MLSSLTDALLLQSGYNAALVVVGAMLLGIAAGCSGTFMLLRKRTLLSDAVAHATLPGIGVAFIMMVWLGGNGRDLFGLLLGSAASAGLGLLAVDWIARRTRLAEDTAIGAILSVFFGFGIVLLTVIQTLSAGKQAGLESFLLGSTAGMLFHDAIIIAGGGAMCIAIICLLRRPMTIVAFDPEFAAASGIGVRATDLAMMTLVTAVTVVGLKVVGLILIVAMLIIPPATARFWSDRTGHIVVLAGVFGGISGYVGAALSASAPKLPTGPIIVLVCFLLFLASFLLAPNRGLLFAMVRHMRFRRQVHRRQGLLALAKGARITDPLTLRVLRRHGFVLASGEPTFSGRLQGRRILRDEMRWEIARRSGNSIDLAERYDGMTPIDSILTPDGLAAIDRQLETGSSLKP